MFFLVVDVFQTFLFADSIEMDGLENNKNTTNNKGCDHGDNYKRATEISRYIGWHRYFFDQFA
jgi:hypothetical protein